MGAGTVKGWAFQKERQLLPKILPKGELERERYPGFSLPLIPPLAASTQMPGVEASGKCRLLRCRKMTGAPCEAGEHLPWQLNKPHQPITVCNGVDVCIMSPLDCDYTSHVGFLQKTVSSAIAGTLSQLASQHLAWYLTYSRHSINTAKCP